MNREQRRKAEKQVRKSFKAFERYLDGRASGDDFLQVAKIFRAAGVLPAKAATGSDQEIAKILQQTDRLISEGVIRLEGFQS